MSQARLEQLYKQSLVTSENSPKELPLDHILHKPLAYYPASPQTWDFDIVEIGPGNGTFLFKLTADHPQSKILAIELGNKRFQKISHNLQTRQITNATLIWGDARSVFYQNIPDNTLQNCYVLFPDPWPRNKHRHRRLLQKDFCKLIVSKLRQGGKITLATDVKDYATWVFANLNSLKTPQPAPLIITQEAPTDLTATYFKEKWAKMGRSFWYVVYEV